MTKMPKKSRRGTAKSLRKIAKRLRLKFKKTNDKEPNND
jgi:hypothetical protein